MIQSSYISPQPLPDIVGYTIVERLYRGLRTDVYRAVQDENQRSVVIKVLNQAYPSFNELLQFRNQYTITKNLNIPGIVHPHQLQPCGNSYALIMEDWGGVSLQDYSQKQDLSIIETIAIALSLTDILHDLHRSHVIHKDVKPANILIHPESKQVKLIDFSIASLLPKETQEIRNPNGLEGTLAYIAPEQTGRMNRGIDYRADFYALGVTLFELLTGQLPFQSTDPMELIHCHLAKQPPQVKDIAPKVPVVVSEIVAKLMAKNAEDRYQSAIGFKYDLERCLTQWKDTGAIAEFNLGERDLSDRFIIPEKLYGRTVEVNTLLNAFDRVADGASELMLVAGSSGIGKTVVVNEVHKPIVRQRGYFIKGKYDQFNRNIPLSAFVQALRDLMGQLLSESDDQLARWNADILGAVGENGRVLLEVMPELEQIIGPQPSVLELSGSAAQNRFNLLFQKFIEVFTTVEHPLVLFLDDLQWADLASLQLIKLLMNDNGYLLILGAYRDNEVSPVHPFSLMIEELIKVNAIVNTITLNSLALNDTNHLIADTLSCSLELAQPLTELVDRKTRGNPFFTTQFLKALYEEGQISFNVELQYWQCDIIQVNALALTDDVVEFMAVKLQKLPNETQQVLKLAACVGNEFDLATLAIVSEQPKNEAASALWNALQEGLILPTSQVYKFFQGAEQANEQAIINPKYRFLHDRVQQAAYSLIPLVEQKTTHLTIGKLLLKGSNEVQRQSRIFEIVGHLNLAAEYIESRTDRHEFILLNLQASEVAKASAAFDSALIFIDAAIERLPQNYWTENYSLTLKLYDFAANVAYLCSNFEQADRRIETILDQAVNLLDKVSAYETQILINIAQSQMQNAVKKAIEVLQQFGIKLLSEPTQVQILLGLAKTKLILGNKKTPQLIDLPVMDDPNALAAMRILSSTASAAYIGAPKLMPLLVFERINLSIRYGNTPLSAVAYAWYGLILCGIVMDIKGGYEFGQLALKLLEKCNAKNLKSQTFFMTYAFISHWTDPVQDTTPFLIESYQIGLETGDVEYAAWSAVVHSYNQYWSGHYLPDVEKTARSLISTIEPFHQKSALSYLQTHHQATLNLLGHEPNPSLLSGKSYQIESAIAVHRETNDGSGLFFSHVCQQQLHFLFDQPLESIQAADFAKPYFESSIALLPTVLHCFYESLARLAIYPSASSHIRKVILKSVRSNHKKLEKWASFAPKNHRHKVFLIDAEKCRVMGQTLEAIDLYDQAIAGAKANGYLQEEAIANELAAKFYLNWGKEKVAASYMQEAYYGYARWGAKAKIQDLERRYPILLSVILEQQRSAVSVAESIFSSGPLSTCHLSRSATSTFSSTSISNTLDLSTVLKASQTLSSEIQLDKLLEKLLQTVIENAGADKGVLLMHHEHQWFVEAVAMIDQPVKVASIALLNSTEVPHSLINSVRRNLTSVVIIDAALHPMLSTDDYVLKQRPKSLLCTPILHQGKLTAILYLENQLTIGAFTNDRIEVLNILCAQVAISLENSRLYQQAHTYVQQLQQSQLQTVQSEKMASLGNLVAGVAHEINNPIGFLNGSIKNTKDYIQDLLGHLELYQNHYPMPVTAIQDNAEEIDLEFLVEDLPKLLSSMNGATDRIKGISTSLRTFSRADTEYTVRANVQEGLDSTILILKYRLKANEHRPAIEIIQQYGDVSEIECFPGQLNQVFMNLLANAIDMFDEAAQAYTFKQLEADPQQITITTGILGDHVEIRISDNGKGMSEEVKNKIFDHLFTTKGVGKGTGLGLAIARQIVAEKHRGSLEVESTIGQGTVFSIRLPR